MKNEKKKMETSKKIIWASYIITGILSAIVVVGAFLGYDMEYVTTIASLSWAELGACNIWYYKKAAKENVPKVIASLPKEFQEMVDINQLLNND